MIGTLIKILFTRLLPLVILLLAVFLGWLNTFPIPEGTFFTLMAPALKGYVPPLISGGFKECPVPPAPEDGSMSLVPRPHNERLVTLAGFQPAPEGGPELPRDLWLKYHIPQQGIGMCCRHTAYDPESVRRTVLWYLVKGGRHFDTADLYLNHPWMGEALQVGMKEYKIPREEIWVTTKLWPRNYGTNGTHQAVSRMLEELQLEYIDLFLMHQPVNPVEKYIGPKSECIQKGMTPKECRLETWQALSEIRETGKIRHIGVSNFNARQVQELQDLHLAPVANNQIQYNPWVPDYQVETFDYCMQQGISVTAWSSFAGTMFQHMQAFTAETLQKIAQAHDTTVAQILLKWAMQKGAIVIPGTGNPKHMEDNLNAYNLQLSDQEMEQITALRKDESAKKFMFQPPDDS